MKFCRETANRGLKRIGVGRAHCGLLVVLAFTLLLILGGSAASAASQAGGQPPFLSEGTTSPDATAESTQSALRSNFQEATVISGLTFPTAVRFANDGRVFVAEKSGLVKVFSSLSDTTSTIVADLRTAVDDYWDRGLLGMVLDSNFPATPYLYLLYTYDAPIGGTAPVWNDACPTPPGPTTDGCVVSGRLSRIQLAGDVMTGSEQVLINAWCQQYPSHSVGDLAFGPDGKLYVSGGEGASFTFTDYGQGGGSSGSPTPTNPCGDPPAGVGGNLSPPTAEGGALRSQSLGRAAGEPVLLNGSVLRVDPTTGAGLPDNPSGGSSDANKRRVIAHGFRNPFRFAFRPGTSELWVGDVGAGDLEEINRLASTTSAVQNFGWPCYEGSGPQPAYQNAGLNLCTALYGSPGSVAGPYFAYQHLAPIVQGESCSTANGSSISGLAFYTGGSYPATYTGGLFFADYSRNCIWAMPVGANGLPDPSAVQNFVTGAAHPVDIETGPGGDLFYVDFDGGTIRRISYVEVTGPDKALGRPASASASEDAALTPDKANDGNSLTRWSSPLADNQWWRVDLGSVQQVNALSLNWEAAYASSYKIQVSSDGTTFTDVATVLNNQSGWKTTSFPTVDTRYLRVLGVTRGTVWGISFWDAQVFGPAGSGGGVPVNVSPPTLSGFAGRGQKLSASTGSWSGSPSSFAYQWHRCDISASNCQSIPGATTPTYSLVAADVGQTVRVAVTASNQAGSSLPAYSALTAAVLPDKALGRPASASASEDAALTPDKANDGNSLTRWSSPLADNQWWRVDLGSVQQVNALSLNWEAAYASSYKIQVSSDGTTFTDVATVLNNQSGWKTTSFPTVDTRYLRVWASRGGPYGGFHSGTPRYSAPPVPAVASRRPPSIRQLRPSPGRLGKRSPFQGTRPIRRKVLCRLAR